MAPLSTLLWLVYPLLVLVGLEYFEPRVLGGLLLLALVLRRRQQATSLMKGLSRQQWGVLAGMALLAVGVVASNSETLLRFYPAAANAGMLLLFGITLRQPPSMVERFARLREPDLPAAGVAYTRRVTQVWCVFFVFNGAIAAWTALAASRAAWAAYNGFIAYLLMGALFAGEWIVRRRFLDRGAA